MSLYRVSTLLRLIVQVSVPQLYDLLLILNLFKVLPRTPTVWFQNVSIMFSKSEERPSRS